MMRRVFVVASLLLVFFVMSASGAIAASSDPSVCQVGASSVTATGLPTDEVINFFELRGGVVVDSWVLGFTSDGVWSVAVSPVAGTSYQFGGRTYGPHGSKWRVFAECAA